MTQGTPVKHQDNNNNNNNNNNYNYYYYNNLSSKEYVLNTFIQRGKTGERVREGAGGS